MDNCKELKRIVKTECSIQGVTQSEQIDYILATAMWETNHTCRPVREAYWLSESWREHHLKYYPYYGRGFVQLTWEANYRKFGKLLGINLVEQPGLALLPQYAIKILVIGMRDGLFTGHSLSTYFNEYGNDFVNARRIINGKDKADIIASMAMKIDLA